MTFDPTGPGTYVVRLTVSDGALSTSLDITVTVAVQPQTGPAIGPLPSQTIRLGDTLSIAPLRTLPSVQETVMPSTPWLASCST